MRTLALVILAGLVPAALAQETARGVLERAVVAHGGHDKLARARADRVSFKGSLHVGPSRVLFTNEVTLRLPQYYCSVVQMQEGSRTRTIVHLLEGDKPNDPRSLPMRRPRTGPRGGHCTRCRCHPFLV